MSSKYSTEIYDFSILLILFSLANVSLGFGDHGDFLCKLREKVKIPKDRLLMQRRHHNSTAESKPRDKTLQANTFVLLEYFLNNLLQDLLNSAFTRLVLTP